LSPLSLHDALPILDAAAPPPHQSPLVRWGGCRCRYQLRYALRPQRLDVETHPQRTGLMRDQLSSGVGPPGSPEGSIHPSPGEAFGGVPSSFLTVRRDLRRLDTIRWRVRRARAPRAVPGNISPNDGVDDSWHFTMGREHVSQEAFERDYRWMLRPAVGRPAPPSPQRCGGVHRKE